MSKRDINLDNYEISKYRYRELHNFCLQYGEMVEKIDNLYNVSAMQYGNRPNDGRISDSTTNKAIKIMELREKVKLIEQTAIETDADIYRYILKAVTQDVPYEQLKIPMGRRQFYKLRHKFFFLLDKNKG